jgi:hypothetical protein
MKQFGQLNWSCSLLAVIVVLAVSDVSVQAQTNAAPPARASAPAAEVKAAARKKVRELYANDLQLAKGKQLPLCFPRGNQRPAGGRPKALT